MDGSHSGQLCEKNKLGAERSSGSSQGAPAKAEEGKVVKALPTTGTQQDITALRGSAMRAGSSSSLCVSGKEFTCGRNQEC